MRVFGLSCSATVRLACPFVAETNKQPIRVLTSVSVMFWIWLDPVSNFERRWRNLLCCGCWQSFFCPLLKYSNSSPDVQNVSLLTHVERVNRVSSPLIFRYSHWFGSQNPHCCWSLNGERRKGSCHTALLETLGIHRQGHMSCTNESGWLSECKLASSVSMCRYRRVLID